MNGLSSKEVLESRKLYGSNKLPEPEMKKWYDFAKEALSEKITMILIAIPVLQLFLGFMGVMELSDPIMLLVVLAIVTGIAVKTGLGVQKSAAELRAKTAVRYCDVIRDGKVQTINKDELVVGDIVCIGMGQEIFADGYIIEGKISVNNAAINGETKECKKSPIPGYIHAKTTSTSAYTNQNCLFAGTTVMAGEGKMIVTDVGVNTVNGDTMVKMQTLESPKTALDIALDNLSDFISKWGTIAEMKEAEAHQKDIMQQAADDLQRLKEEKEQVVFQMEADSQIIELHQSMDSLNMNNESERMLERVREGARKTRERAEGSRIAYDSSSQAADRRLAASERERNARQILEEAKRQRGK